MARKRTSRVYWRAQGGARRAWGDFRDYAQWGGRQEALRLPGERLATTDPDTAAVLVAERLKVLDAAKQGRALLGPAEPVATLALFAKHHLEAKAAERATSDAWLRDTQRHLERAVDYFGSDRPLTAIKPKDVKAWWRTLEQLPGQPRRLHKAASDGRMTGGAVRHHLNSLSNLYRRAIEEELVPPGFNPVGALTAKPKAVKRETEFLEVPDAALVLEAARRLRLHRTNRCAPFLYELLATALLTGARPSEVARLTVADVNFTRRTVTIRGTKSEHAPRTIPLWPQLAEILREYLNRRAASEVFGEAPARHLLFPARLVEGEKPVTDYGKALDSLGAKLGFPDGALFPYIFRHTYTAARLQNLDRGQPVAQFTVAQELGHGGTKLVEKVYGHLGAVRHRSEAPEFRLEQWPAYSTRLQAQGFVTIPVTVAAVDSVSC